MNCRNDKKLSWIDLPYDMQLLVLSYLKGNRALRYQSTSSHFQKLIADNGLWIQYYQQEFGPMDFLENAKTQYVAALLFKEAISVFNHRPDHGHILFQSINTFLTQFTSQAWAHYYFGMIHYIGRGVIPNKKMGLGFFISSLKSGDHRAAIAIVEFILQTNLDHEMNLAFTLSDDVMNALVPALISAHEKGSPLAARLLGYCYLDGIAVKADINIAMTWFTEALKQNLDQHLTDMVWLIKGTLCNAMEEDKSDDQTKMDEVINFSIKQKELYPHSTEIDFQLGLIYAEMDEALKAFTCFQSAASRGHTQAFRELGFLYLNHSDQLDVMGYHEHNSNMAMEKFRMAFDKGDAIAGEYLFDGLEHSEQKLQYFKDKFQNDPLLIVQLLNEYYAHLSLDVLTTKPEASIWLQLSAQFGNKEAFTKLGMLCEKQVVHAWVAMGVIYNFGISTLPGLTANAEQAKHCFEKAIKLDPEAGKHYLEIAQTESKSESLVLKEVKELVMSQASMPCSYTIY